jgi:hypothetical protein
VRRPLAGLLPAALAGAALAGCASETTATTEAPLCDVGDDGASNGVVLMAQSVPSASYVPCLRTALPLGWDFHHLDARDGSARFFLDSDRDGTQAIEVRLEASCDTAGATQIPSDRDGMRRLERVRQVSPTFTGERYYVFDGGCLTVAFHLAGDSPGEALALASQVVGTVRRSVLDAQVRSDSGGRLGLDPTAGGSGQP